MGWPGSFGCWLIVREGKPMDTRNAYRPSSPQFGQMVSPVAEIRAPLPPECRPCCVDDCDGPAHRLELACVLAFGFAVGAAASLVAWWLWY